MTTEHPTTQERTLTVDDLIDTRKFGDLVNKPLPFAAFLAMTNSLLKLVKRSFQRRDARIEELESRLAALERQQPAREEPSF